uniref:Peptidyl-prolyl cis-trans isomerase n=1 Tax=Mustela putorius furo TaxID=9669 RepID=M3XPL7_MUSPF
MIPCNASPTTPQDPSCFDVSIGSQEVGGMKIKFFADIVPKMAKNFRQFCTGEFRKGLVPTGYKGSTFHRVIMDFTIQHGNSVNGGGTRVASVGGGAFAGENFKLRHSAPDLLRGPSTNGSQIFTTCSKCHWLDGKHVQFGKTHRPLVMREIEKISRGPNNKPKGLLVQGGEV